MISYEFNIHCTCETLYSFPYAGLNVYSMLKHNTLVLTEKAARLIEEKLLFHLHRADSDKLCGSFKVGHH